MQVRVTFDHVISSYRSRTLPPSRCCPITRAFMKILNCPNISTAGRSCLVFMDGGRVKLEIDLPEGTDEWINRMDDFRRENPNFTEEEAKGFFPLILEVDIPQELLE